MSNTQVPKVSITEVAESLSVPQNNQVAVGVIGTSQKGTANQVYTISSVSEADTIFGSNYAYGADLVPMIRAAFQEGASVIKAISIGQPSMDSATAETQGTLTADSEAGSTTITVASATIYTAGDIVYVGTGSTYDKEEKMVVQTATGTTVTFTSALLFKHYTGETGRIVNPKTSTDYASAITEMESVETKTMVVCELNDDATSALIVTAINNSVNNYNTPCVYVRGAEPAETASTIIGKANTLNNKRVLYVYPALVDFNGKSVTGGVTAAALCGAIAGNGVPKLNHNFTSFTGFGGVSARITDIDALINAGVVALELKSNNLHLVRFVTTYSKKNGVPDTTWKEAAVRLNVDYIQTVIARTVQSKFLQTGNTPQTRLAIKMEVTALLNQFASSGILVADDRTGTPAFKEPVVSTDPSDATKVNVDIEMSPGKPLNFISLNFKVFL